MRLFILPAVKAESMAVCKKRFTFARKETVKLKQLWKHYLCNSNFYYIYEKCLNVITPRIGGTGKGTNSRTC